MTEAVSAENVVKIYHIQQTRVDAPTPRLRLAQFFFGESFKGHVEVSERRVVDGLNLSVEEGESVALLGPNGAGKSTFLEMVATGLTPDTGSIRVMGYDTVRERDNVKGLITPIFPCSERRACGQRVRIWNTRPYSTTYTVKRWCVGSNAY